MVSAVHTVCDVFHFVYGPLQTKIVYYFFYALVLSRLSVSSFLRQAILQPARMLCNNKILHLEKCFYDNNFVKSI